MGEGPAWSSQGHYLVFSDVTGDTQYRFNWDDQRVTAFRVPSWNSNGNAFDLQGRQISTQDYYRRVVRWEHNGSMTVIADQFDGKPLNSPNDLVAHPDGSIWFTDPPYGDRLSEGRPDDAGGPANEAGKFDPRIGAETAVAAAKRELPTAVYRWDPSGKLEAVITEAELSDPNGICFAPDYKTLYVISTGKGPGDTGSGGDRSIYAFEVQRHEAQRQARVYRHEDRRRAVRPRRHARRYTGQHVVRIECTSGLCRGAGDFAGGQDDWAYPAAGGVRQSGIWWPQARPFVHGGLAIAGYAAGWCARGGTGVVMTRTQS